MVVVTGSTALFLVVTVVTSLVLGLVGSWIGSRKEMGTAGFLLGCFLGPVGLVIVALLPPGPAQRDLVARREGMRQCAHCREYIRSEASVCRFCRRDTIPVGDPVDERALDHQWESLYRS